MGKAFYNLSCEELCDLMCGKPEEDYEDEEDMGRGASKMAASGNSLAGVKIDEKVANNPKFADSIKLLNNLAGEYNTRLGEISTGAERGAGEVDISGYTLKINSNDPATATHEFAHTLANSSADKFGLTNDKAFWDEIKAVKKEYRKNAGDNTNKWISSYEHGLNDVDEFFAEAFTHSKLKQMGIASKKNYGNDYTYSDKVLAITDKYFKKRK